jgi:hypothetical protein
MVLEFFNTLSSQKSSISLDLSLLLLRFLMHMLTFFSIIVFFGINFSFLDMFVFFKKIL